MRKSRQNLKKGRDAHTWRWTKPRSKHCGHFLHKTRTSASRAQRNYAKTWLCRARPIRCTGGLQISGTSLTVLRGSGVTFLCVALVGLCSCDKNKIFTEDSRMHHSMITATKLPGKRSCRPGMSRLLTCDSRRTRKKSFGPTCACSTRSPRPRFAPSAPSTRCRTPRGKFIGGFKTPAASRQPRPRVCRCHRKRGSGWTPGTRRCVPRVRISERALRGAKNV